MSSFDGHTIVELIFNEDKEEQKEWLEDIARKVIKLQRKEMGLDIGDESDE